MLKEEQRPGQWMNGGKRERRSSYSNVCVGIVVSKLHHVIY